MSIFGVGVHDKPTRFIRNYPRMTLSEIAENEIYWVKNPPAWAHAYYRFLFTVTPWFWLACAAAGARVWEGNSIILF